MREPLQSLLDVNYFIKDKCDRTLSGSIKGAIIAKFNNLFMQDELLAMRWLFYVICSLQGEEIFDTIFNYLKRKNINVIKDYLHIMQAKGMWKEILSLVQTDIRGDVIELIQGQLISDNKNRKLGKPVSSLAKHMPSCNTSSAETRKRAKALRSKLNMCERDYRLVLSKLRACILHNTTEEVDWKSNLSSYVVTNSIVVALDSSNSMLATNRHGTLVSTGLSLAAHISSYGEGALKNKFIRLADPCSIVECDPITWTTNSYKTITPHSINRLLIDLLDILQTHKLESPSHLVIITANNINPNSDMIKKCNFIDIANMFKETDHHIPKIVIWNIANEVKGIPILISEEAILISGINDRILKVITSEIDDPINILLRYLE